MKELKRTSNLNLMGHHRKYTKFEMTKLRLLSHMRVAHCDAPRHACVYYILYNYESYNGKCLHL